MTDIAQGRRSDSGRSVLESSLARFRLNLKDAIHLIASASYPYPSVRAALAEPWWVFPAEGPVGGRYLPGTTAIDAVEKYGEELALKLFGDGEGYRASIQPHSGTQANQIVFNACLGPADAVVGLRPADGGHISHTVTIGRRHKVEYYSVNEDGHLDYRVMQNVVETVRPRLVVVGGSAIPRAIDFERAARIAHRAGALLLADISHTATFVAANLHPSVLPHADFVTFNTVKNLRGPNGGVVIYREAFERQVASAVFPGTQGGMNENTVVAKVAALEETHRRGIGSYAERMIALARTMAKVFSADGIPVITGGTDSHLVLLDVGAHGRTGADVERQCETAGVLLNRNLIPGDRHGPGMTSGVRIGTACISILGYQDLDAEMLASWISAAIRERHSTSEEIPALLRSRFNPLGIV
jgi:glycine hydroxymethyltransferase